MMDCMSEGEWRNAEVWLLVLDYCEERVCEIDGGWPAESSRRGLYPFVSASQCHDRLSLHSMM